MGWQVGKAGECYIAETTYCDLNNSGLTLKLSWLLGNIRQERNLIRFGFINHSWWF